MPEADFKPRVYLETTIPSFYHNYRPEPTMVARQEWTREWWDLHAWRYVLRTSAFVLEELSEGEYPDQDQCLRSLDEVPQLELTDEVGELAKVYMQRFVMPKGPSLDAFHLAAASIHRCDILLTWNCVHLANARKSAHIEAVNREFGLPPPRLITPLELLADHENT